MGDVATGPKKIDIRLLVRESWMQNYGFGLFLAFKSSNIDTQFTTYRLEFQSCAPIWVAAAKYVSFPFTETVIFVSSPFYLL